jgi:hypothetical protein
MPPERGTIVFAGSLAQRAGRGGSTWARLQWVLGFRQLGWDVFYLDRLDPAACIDERGQPCAPEASANLAYFIRVMEAFGLGDSYAVTSEWGEVIAGPSRDELLARVGESTLFLNVMGFVRDEDVLATAPRRVFLDIDPGFGQTWRAQGLADLFASHDDYVTIGENIGEACCSIPTCGLRWVTTPQPVVLEEWPEQPVPGDRYTSVVSWRGAYGPLEHQGRIWGLRVHEFRKFAALPRVSGGPFELALDIHPADAKDLSLLEQSGWRLRDPLAAAGDPWRYRRYVQQSRAEFMAAKNIYVQSSSGWFSDRTMCYLASGRPAIVQDTGFSDRYPVGEGLLSFSTLDEAVEAFYEVEADYGLHSRAARRLAKTHFASEVVLGRLLEKLGVN